MNEPLRILLLEDSEVDADLNERFLRKAGLEFESLRVDQHDAFVAALADFLPDLVLADFRLPAFDGLQALTIVRQQHPYLPFIFVTGTMGEETAVEALHQGANDYILKDRLTRLPEAVNRALAEARAKQQLAQAKQALEASEARFRSLVETTTDWIWEIDVQGRYTYSSPAVQALLGYAPEALIGRKLFDLMPPAEAQWVSHRFAEITAARLPIMQLENVNLHRDGHSVILETSGIPLFDAAAQFVGYRGIDRDITARHQTDAALRDANTRAAMLADLLQRSAQPFVQGYGDGRLGLYNPAFLDLVGYSEVEIAQINWVTDLTPPEWQIIEKAKLEELHRTGHVIHYEKEYLRKDGSRVPIELLVHLIRDEAGQPKYYFAFITDISERKQVESALLRQAEELKARNVELESFNRAAVGREMAMIQLKQQVNAMAQRLGEAPPYDLGFLTPINQAACSESKQKSDVDESLCADD